MRLVLKKLLLLLIPSLLCFLGAEVVLLVFHEQNAALHYVEHRLVCTILPSPAFFSLYGQ